MPLIIKKTNGLYTAEEHDLQGRVLWAASEPMGHDSLFYLLYDRGWHTTDIHDAFIDSDPEIANQFRGTEFEKYDPARVTEDWSREDE